MAKPKLSNRNMTRSQAVKYADKWFSLFIRAKGKGICFTCGTKSGVMQCGHLMSRVHFATRWDELNAEIQCSGCNLYHEYNPHRFITAYIRKYGVDQYERLNARHTKVFKITTGEIVLLGDYFKKKYEEISA